MSGAPPQEFSEFLPLEEIRLILIGRPGMRIFPGHEAAGSKLLSEV